MHNDFILVGPPDDPASIEGMPVVDAVKAISEGNSAFISRGDDSGTQKAGLALWQKAGFDPIAAPDWYLETGQGMGASLTVASEKSAYILTDRATYLANQDDLQLDVLVEGDNALLNIYHVITVNPERWPRVNYEAALGFSKFMLAAATQEIIGEFGVDTYGQPLFYPDPGKTDEDLGSCRTSKH